MGLLEWLTCVFALFFLANESWYSIELTLSKRGRAIYKFILIDYDEHDYRVRKRTNVYSTDAPATEMRVFGQPIQYEDQPLSEYGAGDPSYAQYQTPRSPYQPVPGIAQNVEVGPVKYKRRKIDVAYHLACACVAILFTMAFSNWTTIYGFTFTASDVVDTLTVWVRFGGTVAGLGYLLILSIVNLARRSSSM